MFLFSGKKLPHPVLGPGERGQDHGGTARARRAHREGGRGPLSGLGSSTGFGVSLVLHVPCAPLFLLPAPDAEE